MRPPKLEEVGEEAFRAWCGSLQLSPRDEAREWWLTSIAGPANGARIDLTLDGNKPVVGGHIDSEPKADLHCPRCGKSMRIDQYLVDFLTEQGARIPPCESCVRKERSCEP